MTAPEDAIRARRRLTNKLIAAREAQRLRPFFVADARQIALGHGGRLEHRAVTPNGAIFQLLLPQG